MKRNSQKHFLSLAILVFFFFIAGSSTVNKIHYGAFNYYNSVEDKKEGNYIVLNNGTKVKGENIEFKAGLFTKDEVKVDDQKFPLKEVKGYRMGSVYYIKHKNVFIQRIVHGPKINIYAMLLEVTKQSKEGFTSVEKKAFHYSQKGEDGPLEPFGSQKKIKELVADCPEAVKMVDKSNREMTKAIKQNRNYLNTIFDTYNNCK